MDRKMNILGLNIDNISMNEVLLRTKQYLNNDFLNTIFIITAETLIKAEDDAEFKQLIESADTLLPGDKVLLEVTDSEESEEIILNYEFLLKLLDSLAKDKRTMFLIGKSEQEISYFEEYLLKVYPNINCVGSFVGDISTKGEIAVNEINAIAPDILIVALETPKQELWISSNKSKLNSKLCIGIGNAINAIAQRTDIELENELKTKALENIGNSIKNMSVTRKLKKKVEEYKNQKGE